MSINDQKTKLAMIRKQSLPILESVSNFPIVLTDRRHRLGFATTAWQPDKFALLSAIVRVRPSAKSFQ